MGCPRSVIGPHPHAYAFSGPPDTARTGAADAPTAQRGIPLDILAAINEISLRTAYRQLGRIREGGQTTLADRPVATGTTLNHGQGAQGPRIRRSAETGAQSPSTALPVSAAMLDSQRPHPAADSDPAGGASAHG
jgi:hypothetical protein